MKTETIRKKWWLLLIIAAVAAFLLEIVQIKTQPVPYVLVETEVLQAQEKTVFPAETAQLSGYENTEYGLKVVQGDPQIYFPTAEFGKVSQVYFHFRNGTEEKHHIQVFYPDEEGNVSEARSVVYDCPAGAEFSSLDIPEGEYDYLRIDIDGSFIPLETIGVGNIPPERVYNEPVIHIRRIIIVAVLLFAVLIWITWIDGWKRFAGVFQNGFREIRAGKKKSILHLLLFPAAIGAAIFLFWLFCTVCSGKPMTVARIVFAGFTGLSAASLFVFRKTLKTQPEYLFLILVLCVGFLYSWYVPHAGLNGWDEDFHYSNTLSLSYMDSIVMTRQEEQTIIRTNIAPSYDTNGGIQKLHDQQDQMQQMDVVEYEDYVPPASIPEVFSAIGLFAGRALGLRYYAVHFMGRFFSLMTYAFVGFFAIRKLKSGKMIATVSLLVPTEVFIASSYNYDSYLTGFTALGICYFISHLQDREEKLTLKDTLIMIGSIAFGCLTKAVYVPLLWILLLLPRNKFPDKKHHGYFVWTIAIVTVLLLFSAALPSLIKGGSVNFTDTRGGTEVNAVAQIKYILGNPLKFVSVMWRFLTEEYFNLAKAGEALTYCGYYFVQPNAYIYLLLMIAVAFTDKNKYDQALVHHPWMHFWPIALALLTTILAVSAMYVGFTPVGSEGVNGASFRYMIPMFLPVLMFIGSGKIDNQMNRGWYNGLVLSIAAFVDFSCVYNAVISRYF